MQRFVGEICGFGSASGRRVVIGRWPSSPFGSFADAMVEAADGRRTLIAPTEEVAAYIASVYSFDATVVAPVETERVEGGAALRWRSAGGDRRRRRSRRAGLAAAQRASPGGDEPTLGPRWSTPSPAGCWAGVRTRGRSVGGEEFYGATDRHRVTGVRATWDGADLGQLADVDPPVRFGFSSTPRRPSVVAVTTTVRPLPP